MSRRWLQAWQISRRWAALLVNAKTLSKTFHASLKLISKHADQCFILHGTYIQTITLKNSKWHRCVETLVANWHDPNGAMHTVYRDCEFMQRGEFLDSLCQTSKGSVAVWKAMNKLWRHWTMQHKSWLAHLYCSFCYLMDCDFVVLKSTFCWVKRHLIYKQD